MTHNVFCNMDYLTFQCTCTHPFWRKSNFHRHQLNILLETLKHFLQHSTNSRKLKYFRILEKFEQSVSSCFGVKQIPFSLSTVDKRWGKFDSCRIFPGGECLFVCWERRRKQFSIGSIFYPMFETSTLSFPLLKLLNLPTICAQWLSRSFLLTGIIWNCFYDLRILHDLKRHISWLNFCIINCHKMTSLHVEKEKILTQQEIHAFAILHFIAIIKITKYYL